MQPADQHHRLQRWRRVHWRARWRLGVHGLVLWLAITGAVALAVIVALGSFAVRPWVAQGLVVSGMAIVALAAALIGWPVWRRLRTRTEMARLLDRAGGHHDTLAAVDEVLARPERWSVRTPVQAALVGRLLARGDRLLGDLQLWRLLPVIRPWATFTALLVVVIAATSLENLAPQVMQSGRERAITAWHAERPIAGGLRVVPGESVVLAGEDRTVAVLDLVAVEPEPPVCEVRIGQGAWRTLPTRAIAQDTPYQRWEADLREVREDLRYRFRRGARVSDERELVVQRPPLLSELAAVVRPPAYTNRPPRELDRLPAYLEVRAGSELALHGRASSPLRSARLIGPADTTMLTVEGPLVMGQFTLVEPRRFTVELEDRHGLAGHGELTHEIVVVPDRVPDVRLRRPDDDGHLPLSAPLLLEVTAEDDHGLIAVDLMLRRGDDGGSWAADLDGAVSDEGWTAIPLLSRDRMPRAGQWSARTDLGTIAVTVQPRPVSVDAAVALGLELSLAELSLVPGDVLEIVVAARDNRQPPPAGEGRSSVLRLQVPSSLELLAEREEAAGEHQAGLAEMKRQTHALSAELERLRRELLKNPLLDWDRRQELQAALERQQAVHDQIEQLAQALGEDLEKLAENRLTSPELLEKMDRIAELLAEQENRSLESMLESLREQLDQMSPKEMNQAMEDLAREQTEMQRRLDTAMDMLEDLAREQDLEGLVDMTADMLAQQQRLAEEARELAEAEQGGEDPADADQESEAQEGESEGEEGDDAESEGETTGEESSESQEGAESGEQSEQSEQSQPSAEELARQQEALAEQMEKLTEQLEETLAELQEESESGEESAAEKTMREALEEALAQLQEQQTGQKMQDAGESMEQEQSDQASQQMDQALTDLAGLYHVMLKTQAAMQMAMQQEQAGQMRDVAADLLQLSERQEQVGVDVPASLRDVRADDLSRRQHEVLQGTITVRDALAEVAEAAPQEILRMLSQLDELIEAQGDVLEQLKEGRARSARRSASSSLAELNRVVINLLTQAQMTGQGGGSGQQQQTMSQQLRQMSEQQSGLQSLAEQLRRQQGGLSQELRAGMQRLQQGQQGLAGQARELAEQQEQLERQTGQTGRLLGDLSALADEMERVGDDAATGLITEQTLRRQERILSRLLDMHNASRERDWAKRRESRHSDELFAEQEGVETFDDESAPAERRWRPAEEAPPAYRDLVRRYFQEVQRLHEDTGRDAAGRRDDGPAGGT